MGSPTMGRPESLHCAARCSALRDCRGSPRPGEEPNQPMSLVETPPLVDLPKNSRELSRLAPDIRRQQWYRCFRIGACSAASACNALQSLKAWTRKWCQNSAHDAPVAARFLDRSSGSLF